MEIPFFARNDSFFNELIMQELTQFKIFYRREPQSLKADYRKDLLFNELHLRFFVFSLRTLRFNNF